MKSEDQIKYNIKCLKQLIKNNELQIERLEAELSRTAEAFNQGIMEVHVSVKQYEENWQGVVTQGSKLTLFYGETKSDVVSKVRVHLTREALACRHLEIDLGEWDK